MEIWISWWDLVKDFRSCFSRKRTFLWFLIVLVGFLTRKDLLGVSSFIRALGLKERSYASLLGFFHSSGFRLDQIIKAWVRIVFKFGHVKKLGDRPIILGDGLKRSKEGKKMPAVKSLCQESQNNSKPEYIMGHFFQGISVLTGLGNYFFATPLACKIHDGIKTSPNCLETSIDKMAKMFFSLDLSRCIIIFDAFYACGSLFVQLKKAGHHVITRCKSNVVAYKPAPKTRKKKLGRPKKYGKKILLKNEFEKKKNFQEITVDMYGEKNVKVLVRTLNLFWRPMGQLVRFVLCIHPTKGKAIFVSTDLTLSAIQIISLYSLRFKIEVGFKAAIHSIGAFGYHFWMKTMEKISRRSGNQFLHKKSEEYRDQVNRKVQAYNLFVTLGLIAQGITQIIAQTQSQLVWKCFGSWFRTAREDVLPSEKIVMISFRNTLGKFLRGKTTEINLEKFIRDRIDLARSEGMEIAA